MVRFILYFVLQMIGLSMVLIPGKSYNRTEKDKQYHKRRELTVYEVCMLVIGILIFFCISIYDVFNTCIQLASNIKSL